MKKIKKFITNLLLFSMLLGMFPQEVFAIDYTKPNFSGQKFILTRASSNVEILHKFSFGSDQSQINYSLTNQGVFRFNPSDGFSPLQDKYGGQEFEIFHATRNPNSTEAVAPIGYDLIAIKKGSSYSVIGLYWPEFQNASGGCLAPTDVFGIAKSVTTSATNTSTICIYDPQSFDSNGTNKHVNNNYKPYVYGLNNILLNSPITTTEGAGSVVMTPTQEKIDSCLSQEKGLAGPLNTNYPEYFNTFVDTLGEQVRPEYKDKLREFAGKDDVKISNSEDAELFRTYYSSSTSNKYADKYMDDSMDGGIIALVNAMGVDNSLKTLYEKKLWFEEYFSQAVGTGVVVGTTGTVAGTYAYSLGTGALATWMSNLSTVARSKVLTNAMYNMAAKSVSAGGIAPKVIGTFAGVAGVVLAIALVIAAAVLFWYYSDKNAINTSYVKNSLKLIYALTYIMQNKQNQECTGLWAKYPEQQQIYDHMFAVSNNALDDAKQAIAAGINPQDVCEEIPGWGMVAYLNRAFCSLALMIAEWADSLLIKAFDQLKVSLEYTSTSQ